MRYFHALVVFVLVITSCGRGVSQDLGGSPNARVGSQPVVTEKPLSAILDSLSIHLDDIRMHVDKSDRMFSVFAGGRLLKTYPCVLGEQPIGDKYMQGDRKTPEGTFGFRSKRVHPKWHAFVWVDYPNAESRRRFAQRKREGAIPAGKDIGGEIGIHGVPDGMEHWIQQGVDWTWGCIALRNADLDEVYEVIRPGRTTITIVP